MVSVPPASAQPKVSVLVPTFNYGRYLRQTLDSILAQDFADFELIISDDASQDDSAEILREYAARDPRIHAYAHRENLGMVQNWNWCLRHARGEYVKFMFGDDCFTRSDALSQMVAALDRAPQAALVASARLLIDEHSRVVSTWDDFRAAGHHHGISVIRRCLHEDRNLVGEPSTVLFRRDQAARGFDPNFRQIVDEEFWLHLLLRGDFVYLTEPLCAFRQHGAQQTRVNQGSFIGPLESLLLLTRYIDCISNPAWGGCTPFQRRRILYRRLHYSRKRVPRSARILVAEAMVHAHLRQPWYAVMWTHHRVTGPFHRLRTFLVRTFGPGARALPSVQPVAPVFTAPAPRVRPVFAAAS
ncbi:glycosyltransferase [Opitutus sp. ER46]|uniref:glycosyltransferase family 2 protein n=1 Tax=Opitutus sp. ER46 TaxID=2161864 RepID=UPI000D320445|nr:glycosyltransferase [Opitutus sp. ER46]PTX92543.1 glycosyl transferase family 2 [Opitutus sp. ER46]